MSKQKDFIDQLHSTGLYLPTRTLFLTGEVNLEMYESCIYNLHILDTNPQETATIYLNSEGGCVTQAFAIYDAIRAMKSMVRGILWGESSSSASMITQAFDERIMSPNSEMLIHIGEEEYAQNHPKNIENQYKNSRKVEERMKQIYLQKIKEKKPRYTKAKFEELWQFDKTLTPKECKDLGLIDMILDTSL